MPSWKKLIVSGSDASLSSLTATSYGGNISGSATSTGSFGRVEATTFSGDGSGLTGVGSSVFPFTGNAVIKGDFIVENPSGGDDLISASIASRTVEIGDVGMAENQTKFVVDDANAKVYVPSTDTKFGIGTDSPNERLHVVGNIFATGNVSGSSSSTGSFGQVYAADVVRSGGDVIAYYSSDERLKDNIKLIEKPIEKIKQLRGVEYQWNEKQNTYPSGSLDSGIIAQDVQKVLPQLVKQRGDGYLGVRQERLVGLLVESIKDQQDQIDDLRKQIKEMKDGSS